MSDERSKALIAECQRQEENCLYTSTTFYIWLRKVRRRSRFFIVAPIVFGALATWSVLDQPEVPWVKWLTATLALLAGLLPAIYEALKLDVHIDVVRAQAAEFKNLQDRFRQASQITALGPLDEFKAEFDSLMQRVEAARSESLTPPERCFQLAQKKIKKGDYSFTTDEKQSGMRHL